MDRAKQASFVAMAKRQKFSKGGMIRKLGNKKYFAIGGPIAGASGPSGPSNTSLGGAGSGTNQSASNPNTGILGSISGALGLNNNFQAQGANIQNGTTTGQLQNAYSGAQGALGQTQTLANTLTPQAANAVQNQNQLAEQYSQMAQGQGPNPAQAELAQQTGQNVNNQAALMAGQRGASGNVGLMARNIAQQGAATQQGAAGQAATLEAQQQIAAQQNLANLSANQIGQTGQAIGSVSSGQQNEQGILQNANTSANNANAGMQANINSTNASTAAGNQGIFGGILGGVASGASGVLSSIGLAHGGEVPDHVKMAEMNAASMAHAKKHAIGGNVLVGNPLVGNQSAAPPVNNNWAAQYMAPGAASSGPNIQAGPTGAPAGNSDLSDSISTGITNFLPAKEGPSTDGEATDWETGGGLAGEPTSTLGAGEMFAAHGGNVCQGPYQSHVANYLAEGGKVPAMVSPGEIYLSPEQAHKVVTEGVDPAKVGRKFHGKAKVKGDSYSNDTIPTDLEEGGIVIDRKNMGTKEKRELFVHRMMAKHKAGRR